MKKVVNFFKKIAISFKNMFLRLISPKQMKRDLSILEEEALMSPGKIVIRNFFKNKLALTGLIGFSLMLLLIFGMSSIYPLDVLESSGIQRNVAPGYNYLSYPKALEREGVAQISTGNSFSVGLSDEGNVFVWGLNTKNVKAIPDAVREANIVTISTGSTHVVALTDTNELIMWGFNNHGQASLTEEQAATFSADPVKIAKAGDEYTVVVTQSGKLYVWGALKNRGLDRNYATPVVPIIRGEIQDITPGPSHVALLLTDGTIQIIGGRAGDTLRSITPEFSDGSLTFVKVVTTEYNGFALTDDGRLFAWGAEHTLMTNDYLPYNAKTEIKDIGAGRLHMVVLRNDNTIVTWGDNTYNQLNAPRRIAGAQKIFVSSFQNYAVDSNDRVHAWGHRGFIFGSDERGRDLFVRFVHGGRITMTVGAVAVLISVFIGVTVGLTAGFYGKWMDMLLMRFAEIISSFPFLPLVITLSAIIPASITQNQRLLMIMVILGVLSWPGLSRLVRGQLLSEREKDFVLAARATGIKEKNIITRHILPNIINIVIVSMTLGYAGTLLTEAGLSYLGFGVIPPRPSWGNMLTASQRIEVMDEYWWQWIFPGLGVIIAALSINLVGDGLREAMDPKANER